MMSARADTEGIERSNFASLGSWHSHINLHKSPAYKPLVDLIGSAGDQISNKLGYREDYSLKIGSMWSIINPPGCYNRAHIHPGSHWSGVYYVQTPEASGKIEFTDPRTQNLINQPKYLANTKRPRQCWSNVNFTPTAGRMMIFPSWLYHSVYPNLSEESGKDADRVIISFNLTQRPN